MWKLNVEYCVCVREGGRAIKEIIMRGEGGILRGESVYLGLHMIEKQKSELN